jgi:hypothetical protein
MNELKLRSLVSLSEFAADPCYRDCHDGKPMTCEYNFTVGEYVTKTAQCASCITESGQLGDAEACRTTGCIAGGGRVRIVSAVNSQVPGPKIEVC